MKIIGKLEPKLLITLRVSDTKASKFTEDQDSYIVLTRMLRKEYLT